ncbi:type IV pilus modification PilV family protein [Acinetobacter sp. GSS19]|uniref:type IV pilus modification PilV family protein n=1 Tax=Acinetobacter sp. GSS19 TaxID=3020716 RepID=UPI002362C121|nr:prepilin-type N-terminal cleavage/methylation domain-containing protein [Acinetobacter sp. GSS19]
MKINVSQRGFTLLEALIAMFLTAGALLGLGVLHLKSVQQSQLATQRTIANIQANDLIDRMWANLCSLSTQKTTVISSWQNDWNSTTTNGLSTNQKAMHQMMNGWQGTVTEIDTTRQRFQVVISWTNAKAAWYRDTTNTTANQQSFSYQFTLPKCAS